MGREQQPNPSHPQKLFSDTRKRTTEQNPATQHDGVGIVLAIEQTLAEQNAWIAEGSSAQPDTFFRIGKHVTVELFPYKDERSYLTAPRGRSGRPYLAAIENIGVETNPQTQSTIREHVYVDHEYNVFTARFSTDRDGQVRSEVIPASFEDVVRVIDVFDKKSEEVMKREGTKEDREKRIEQIQQFKDTLNDCPEFIEALADPFEPLTEESKKKALNDFWTGNGQGVSFLLNGRLVEVAYLIDLRSQEKLTLPDAPDTYEQLTIFFHPADGIDLGQQLIIGTTPASDTGIFQYEELQGWHTRIASDRKGTVLETQQGAQEIMSVIKKQTKPKSILGFSILDPSDADDKHESFEEETLRIDPRDAPNEDNLVLTTSRLRSRPLGTPDPNLDRPYMPTKGTN